MTKISEIGNCLILSSDNTNIVGLNTGLTPKGTTGTEFSDYRRDKGYILRDSNLVEFTLPEIEEINGKVVIYSNDLNFDVKPLFSTTNDIGTIRELVSFVKLLQEKGVDVPNFSTNLFYRNKKNEIFIFPPRIIEFLNSRRTMAATEKELSLYSHPDLKNENSFLFSVGILLFKQTTGEYPIEYSSVEDLRDKVRRKRIMDPRWKNIYLSDRAYALIKNLLFQEENITISECLNEMIFLEKNGFERELEDSQILQKTNEKRLNSFLKNDRRKAFLNKNLTAIVISTVVFVIVVSFFGTIIKKTLEPPATTGFTSEQVVEAYFTSFQTLDASLIQDVLGKDVRNNDEREVSTLFVTSSIRKNAGDDVGFITPREWNELEDIKKDKTPVYGIHNLDIKPISEDKFQVNYEKWYTEPEETELREEIKLIISRRVREEIFTLVETKYSYEVSQIDTVSEKIEKVW